MRTGLAQSVRGKSSKMPPLVMDSMMARAQRELPTFIDSLVPLYAASQPASDLKEVALFLESPVGQRYAAAQAKTEGPQTELAKRWGMRVALEVMTDLSSKGLLPLDSL